jgi:hypothetical protein
MPVRTSEQQTPSGLAVGVPSPQILDSMVEKIRGVTVSHHLSLCQIVPEFWKWGRGADSAAVLAHGWATSTRL